MKKYKWDILKGWLGNNRIIFILALCAFIISLYYLNTGFYTDDYYQQLAVSRKTEIRAYAPGNLIYNPLQGLYSILDHNPDRSLFLKEKGLLPWWTPEQTLISFWRPLATFSLLLDYTLWPDNPRLTEDNRIAEMLFTFAAPLESNQYNFVFWDWRVQQYLPVRFPEVGEAIRFDSKGSPVTP